MGQQERVEATQVDSFISFPSVYIVWVRDSVYTKDHWVTEPNNYKVTTVHPGSFETLTCGNSEWLIGLHFPTWYRLS